MIRLWLLGSLALFAVVACGASGRAPGESPPRLAATATPNPTTSPPRNDESANPAPPVNAVTDARGCILDRLAHAAGVALESIGPELEDSLGHPAEKADLVGATCSRADELPDLDRDGTPDADVSLCVPPGGHVWHHYVYLSNSGCTRFAGHLGAAELTPVERKNASVKDLESVAANGCAGNDFTWTLWVWDGKTYTQNAQATCELCSDPGAAKRSPGANRAAYCQREIARRKAQPGGSSSSGRSSPTTR